MKNVTIFENGFSISLPGELIVINTCGNNAIRFRSFPNNRIIEENYTLMPINSKGTVIEEERSVSLISGNLSLTVEEDGRVSFRYLTKNIIKEKKGYTFGGKYREFVNTSNEIWKTSVAFEANENEHFYGLGHSWDSSFDLKGSTIDICNINAKCVIPYIYSSLGYGFIWNNPSIGRVELSFNRTKWVSEACKFMDYVVIGGNPKEVSSLLADLTGHSPKMPYWATGLWQSRLRYENQNELLNVARKYKELNIPLSAIVVDYFHWTEQGDYKFDSKYWPDVKNMANELHEMNTKLVVSVWPTINEKSENYQYMYENNMLMHTKKGSNKVFPFYGYQAQIDVTNPLTREYVWNKLKNNYIDNGVDALWFDVAEPEIEPSHFDNLIWCAGNGDTVALLYPYYYSKMAYDGLSSLGRGEIITLIRSAYLGSQKFASLVWSGDIASTFESLSCQIKGGLNMGLCGIPWWNTDIGGFYGADITSDYFKELIVRWFQYGLFSPVMRLHGARIKHGTKTQGIKEPSGDPNELWSFGEDTFLTLKELVLTREKLRPYIQKISDEASIKGYPIMRPMFFEYPEDEVCYSLDEQYMFGCDILFAPITKQGQKEKKVYLPKGKWILAKDKTIYETGWHIIKANINEYIAFVKDDSDVIKCF